MPKTAEALHAVYIGEVEMTLGQLTARLADDLSTLNQIITHHEDYARTFLPDERAVAHAQGLIHGEDEAQAIDAILDTAERFPSRVQDLADKDNGADPAAFEVDPIAARLHAAKHLHATGKRALDLAHLLLDTAASLGLEAKPTTQAAYRLLKPAAPHNPQLQTSLAPAITFHTKRSGKRVRQKK